MLQQIAGYLLNRKLIEWLVPVKGIDDVIAVGKNVHILIAVIPNRIGKPNHIQPRHGDSFAKMSRGEQPIHLLLISSWTPVRNEAAHFLRRRRNANQIKAQSPEQRSLVCFL